MVMFDFMGKPVVQGWQSSPTWGAFGNQLLAQGSAPGSTDPRDAARIQSAIQAVQTMPIMNLSNLLGSPAGAGVGAGAATAGTAGALGLGDIGAGAGLGSAAAGAGLGEAAASAEAPSIWSQLLGIIAAIL